MGAGVSKAQIGERVKSAKKKLAESSRIDDEKYVRLSKVSPETLVNMVKSIEKALMTFSPFPESTLLLAFKADPQRVQKALTECTQKALTAPIQKSRYQWFMQYVFPSTVWFKKVENGKYLYQEMMRITNVKQTQIIENMDNVYDHLKSHNKWSRITSIRNQTVISRQDDDAVGLLQEAGIRDILEVKDSDDDNDDIDELKNYIDNNLAVNILMTTAKEIDQEFQREMSTVLNRHGDFKPGPMKKVERALSKLENDYINEEYPKAAKLLDIVRCSASYNTIGQLLDGYNAFIEHIESGISSMTLARIKNGFSNQTEGGYRDIKVNVVYQSTLNPNSKMICEVQFILNQYLYEKKRVHKLYSIAREQTYFEMVALKEDELTQKQKLKALKFDPILNVGGDITINHHADNYFKSSIESHLGLLGMNGGYDFNSDKFFCVDMDSKQLIWQNQAYGKYTHHWITINDQKYLSLQTTKNTISYFRVSDDHQFEEDESMKIVLDDDDVINFCEYDKSVEHIFVVRNKTILEKRAVADHDTVSMSIALQDQIGNSVSKLLSMSNDGKFCVIGTGATNDSGRAGFFYLIYLETQKQFKLQTENLSVAYAPCFINGESEFVAIGGNRGGEGVEIWSVQERKMVKYVECDDQNMVTSSYSANGILAVGYTPPYSTGSRYLQLYDVSTWEKLYRQEFAMCPRSLFLTADLRYLVTGGTNNNEWNHIAHEKCMVHKIQ